MRATLTRKRDIERLFDSGVAGRTHFLTVIAAKVADGSSHGRVMVVAGRSVGSAVRRNRAKRVLREAVRRAGGPWAGHHVAVIAKPRLLEARLEQVEDALRRALTQAGVSE